MLLLRSMAPEVIAVDELGGEEEIRSVRQALKCGCTMLATIHAGNMEEAQERLSGSCAALFSRYVLLSGKGNAEGDRTGRSTAVLDEEGSLLWREGC